MIDVIKHKFENSVIIKDEDINKLQCEFDNLLDKVYQIDPDLSSELDSKFGKIISAYVDCCFKGGFKYGLNVEKLFDF